MGFCAISDELTTANSGSILPVLGHESSRMPTNMRPTKVMGPRTINQRPHRDPHGITAAPVGELYTQKDLQLCLNFIFLDVL